MLRVIAGSLKGRRLKTVPGDTTRPVTDRVKESLFNILADDVVGSSWWDVFSGTGAISIEAISRGASFATMCDLNRLPIETIRSNVQTCGIADQVQVVKGDAFQLLGLDPKRKYDFIYIAPPQYLQMWEKAMLILDKQPAWLKDTGDIIVQIHPIEYKAMELTHFVEYDQRKYGSTLLIFYKPKEGE